MPPSPRTPSMRYEPMEVPAAIAWPLIVPAGARHYRASHVTRGNELFLPCLEVAGDTRQQVALLHRDRPNREAEQAARRGRDLLAIPHKLIGRQALRHAGPRLQKRGDESRRPGKDIWCGTRGHPGLELAIRCAAFGDPTAPRQ